MSNLTWKGKSVDEMSKEELIEALEAAAKLYKDLLDRKGGVR